MRVLHVTSTFAGGGIATSLWHLLPSLNQAADLEIEIAGLYDIGVFGARLVAAGIPAHNLHLTNKYDPRGLAQLVQILQSGPFDVVHAHGWPAVLFVAFASYFSPTTRVLLTEHNISNRRRRWHLKPLERFLYSRFQRIVAVSRAAAAAVVAYLPETAPKVRIMHNVLNRRYLEAEPNARFSVRAALGLAQDATLILSGGGLDYKKGIDVLLRALAHLDRTHPALTPKTCIASDGPQRTQLEQLALQLRLETRVQFIGFQTALPRYMAAADLLVSSSRWEGCPMVILEGMALGMPIVATAVGGVPELIETEVNGLLVPPQDPAALADAMARVLYAPAWAKQLGCVAQQRVEQFSVHAQAPRFIQLYREL